jgi:hypothetical protein
MIFFFGKYWKYSEFFIGKYNQKHITNNYLGRPGPPEPLEAMRSINKNSPHSRYRVYFLSGLSGRATARGGASGILLLLLPRPLPTTGWVRWPCWLVKADERLISRTRSGGEAGLRSFLEVAAITGVPGGVEGCADANRNNTPHSQRGPKPQQHRQSRNNKSADHALL